MTRQEWEREKELVRNEPEEEPEDIPTDIDGLMAYNGVSCSDFF